MADSNEQEKQISDSAVSAQSVARIESALALIITVFRTKNKSKKWVFAIVVCLALNPKFLEVAFSFVSKEPLPSIISVLWLVILIGVCASAVVVGLRQPFVPQ